MFSGYYNSNSSAPMAKSGMTDSLIHQQLAMRYVRRGRRDAISPAVPILLAAGVLGVIAVVWRRLAAPRTTERIPAAAPPDAASVAAPATGDGDQQTMQSGSGSVFHRRYEVELTGMTIDSAALLLLMQRHIAELSPSLLAHFEKSAGHHDLLRVDDEYEITMLGPWNGKVRVAESTRESFTFVTLEGHPEAGHITFSVSQSQSDACCVCIESWARSRDGIVATAYATLGIGKQVQTEVWVTFLQRLSEMAGGNGTPEVRITDEVMPVTGESDTDIERAQHV